MVAPTVCVSFSQPKGSPLRITKCKIFRKPCNSAPEGLQ